MTCSVSGICPVCDRLVAIVARGHKRTADGFTSREQAWAVQPHTALGDDTGGNPCDGTGKVL